MDKYLSNILYQLKSETFWNEGTFTQISSVWDLPVILKWHGLQSLDKALDFFNKILYEQILLSEQSKICKVAAYKFGLV